MTATTTMASVPMPMRIGELPRDRRGYPVPWFVSWIDGEPDFRVVRPEQVLIAAQRNLCWICGQDRGRELVFNIGPMCAVNRVSAEPPSHMACAVFAARVCPFLTKPKARRRDKNLPVGSKPAAGIPILRNPGVALVWSSKGARAFMAGNGLLFDVGEPRSVSWYAEGRLATRAEVMASIDSGLPILQTEAESEGPAAVAELQSLYAQALQLVPA